MDSILIHDTNCENAVLGSIIGNDNAFSEVQEYLSPDAFYDWMNKKIYGFIIDSVKAGEPADYVFIGSRILQENNSDELNEHFVNDIIGNFTRDYLTYARRLNDLSIKRRLWRLSKTIEKESLSELTDAYDTIAEISKSVDKMLTNSPAESVVSIKTAIGEFLQVVNDNTNGTAQSGFMTDFRIFDENGGLHPSDLVIIAAESSQGKSSLALCMVLNAAKYGTPCAIYSMEMTNVQLMARLVSVRTGINNKSLLYRAQDRDRLYQIDLASGALENLPIYLDQRSTSNIDTIISGVRRMARKNNVKVFVIDYIQMLTVNSGKMNRNEEQMLGEIARRLKNLAKELSVCIIAISQLSRNMESPLPTVNRLRGSGQIVDAADVIALLYRPEAIKNGKENRYPGEFATQSINGTAMIRIGKGRNTGLADCIVGFDANCTRFYEIGGMNTLVDGQVSDSRTTMDDDPF